MEHHGEIPKQNIIAIIPARYASTRLPGKLLLDIAGEPLIIHTLRRASQAKSVCRVVAATDDQRIFDAVSENGFEAVMTSPSHNSGSDRVAEVALGLENNSIIVNVQGDEPLIPPETIDAAVAAMISDDKADIVTTCEFLVEETDALNPNIVKVVTDVDGYALYFSRAPIPFLRALPIRAGVSGDSAATQPFPESRYRKHTGLYVYRRDFLIRFAKMKATPLEQLEMLEQLRALEHGAKIRVVDTNETSVGVDTFEDLEKVRDMVGNFAGL